MRFNPAKCSFAKLEFEVLGHLCSKEGVAPNPKKVSAITEYPEPQDREQLHRWLGLVTWVCRFIFDCSRVTKPLRDLLHSDDPYRFTEEHRRAFNEIKESLASPPILAYPDFQKSFYIWVDTSKDGIGVILTQIDDEGRYRVIAFGATSTPQNAANSSPAVLEGTGLVWAVTHFRQYIHGRKYYIITDHLALRSALNKPSTSRALDKLATVLMEHDFEIIYKPGKSLVVPDAISRARYVSSPNSTTSLSFDDLRLSLPGEVESGPTGVGRFRSTLSDTVASLVHSSEKPFTVTHVSDSKVVIDVGFSRPKFNSNILRVSKNLSSSYESLLPFEDAASTKDIAQGFEINAPAPKRFKSSVPDFILSQQYGVDEVRSNPLVPETPIPLPNAILETVSSSSPVNTVDNMQMQVEPPACADSLIDPLPDVTSETYSLPDALPWLDQSVRVTPPHILTPPLDIPESPEIIAPAREETPPLVLSEHEIRQSTLASMMVESFLRSEVLLPTEQRRDPDLRALIDRLSSGVMPSDRNLAQWIKRKEHMFFVDDRGILRRVVGHGESIESTLPAVLPAHMVDLALYYFHNDPLGAHRGPHSTYERLRKCFFFPDMYVKTFSYCKSCLLCQIMKAGKPLVPCPGSIDDNMVGAPGLCLHLDCTKLTKTERGKTHCLNIMCSFSRFCHFLGIRNPSGRQSADKLVKYIGIFGCPTRIVSDNGTEFNNALVSRLCEVLSVNPSFITAYNSRGNGVVERPWSSLKEIVRCFANKYVHNWDILLPLFRLAVNSTINRSTGYSPFFLHFGRHPITPFEASIASTHVTKRTISDYVDLIRNELPTIFQIVRERSIDLSRANAINRLSNSKSDNVLKPGELVMMRNHYFEKGDSKKLLPKYKRTIYEVVSHPTGQAYQLRNLTTGLLNNALVNARELKRFHPDRIGMMEPGTYEISRIISKRSINGKTEYLVEWLGFSGRHNSWVNSENLNAPNLLREYERTTAL